MKCCVSTVVGTWTNWLTFDPDHSPDARTGLLSPIAYALQRGILLRQENPTYWYWAPVESVTHGYEALKHCSWRSVHSTECTSSLLVVCWLMLGISSASSVVIRAVMLSWQLYLLWHSQPALPTPEEAYNFCMRVWESDSEKEEKKVKEKPATVAETEEEASAAETSRPPGTVDDAAEVQYCSILCLTLMLFIYW